MRMKKNKRKQESTHKIEYEDQQIKVKEHSLLSNMRFVLTETFHVQPRLRWMMPIVMIFTALSPYVYLYIQKFIIQSVENQEQAGKLYWLIGITAGLFLIMKLVNTAVKNDISWRFMDVRMNVMLLRNRKLMTMDYESLERPDVLDLSQKASRSLEGSHAGVEGMLHSTQAVFITMINVLAGISILVLFSPVLVLILLVLSAAVYYVIDHTKKLDKIHVWDLISGLWRKEYYFRHIITSFDSAKDIRLFSMSDWMKKKMQEPQDEILGSMYNCRDRWAKASVANQSIGMVQRGVAYGWLIYYVLYRNLSIADFSLYAGAIISMFAMLVNVFNVYTDLRNHSRQVDDLRTFFSFSDSNTTTLSSEKIDFSSYEFRFEQVSFKYLGAENYALKDLTLTLRPGERLAVVGLNGAGKSTFIKLLCGLYSPTEGNIYLNDRNIQSFDKMEYFRLMAPLFQQIELFASSVSENISMLPKERTDEKLVSESIANAGLKDKIDSLPNGIQTELLKILYDDGVDLSGGEKQKLAFSRALYKDAPVVVLDEPTSALDAIAEYELYQEFNKLIGTKIAVFISHRLSSTRFCDRVAMFAGGSLVEYGTHLELLEKKGAYFTMFEIQAQYYKESEIDDQVESVEVAV